MPATSFEEENNVAQDGDDDDDDIIAKALRYAGVLPPTSSMDYPSPVIPPVSPAPACASGNYEVHPTIRMHVLINEQTSDVNSQVVPTRCK
ncbi:unnamed protein product [Taenia asiatica]|uniref:Uncharacterized protein n=1 Tax=Taenia asiatica TaxID=60517 RepID=A0A0R3VZ83_TAEAS|nr:unnamed protein product [Taenia asiatica]